MGLENPTHILLVLIVVLLVFGAKRLPELGRSLGDGMRGFKDALSGLNTHDSLPHDPLSAMHPTGTETVTPTPVPATLALDTGSLAERDELVALRPCAASAAIDFVPESVVPKAAA